MLQRLKRLVGRLRPHPPESFDPNAPPKRPLSEGDAFAAGSRAQYGNVPSNYVKEYDEGRPKH
ncbi:MAG TPA: hypothetical protein VLU96_03835 [Gaiellaceae bacterium]|nr:hypothetical protein [Gaiellaceae bacterium]